MLSTLIALLWKDFAVELRRGDVFATLLSLSLLLGSLVAFGVQAGPLTPEERLRLFPYLLWIPTLLVGTVTSDKLLEKDYEEDSFSALALLKIPMELCFISKMVVGTTVTLLGHAVSVLTMAVLLNLPVGEIFFPFALLSLVTVVAFSALSVLVSAMTLKSERISLLQPLVLIPLLFPLFFAASDATASLLLAPKLFWGQFSTAFVGGLAVLYATLGFTLFEVAVRE